MYGNSNNTIGFFSRLKICTIIYVFDIYEMLLKIIFYMKSFNLNLRIYLKLVEVIEFEILCWTQKQLLSLHYILNLKKGKYNVYIINIYIYFSVLIQS